MLDLVTGFVLGCFVTMVAGPELKAVAKKLYNTVKNWLDSM